MDLEGLLLGALIGIAFRHWFPILVKWIRDLDD